MWAESMSKMNTLSNKISCSFRNLLSLKQTVCTLSDTFLDIWRYDMCYGGFMDEFPIQTSIYSIRYFPLFSTGGFLIIFWCAMMVALRSLPMTWPSLHVRNALRASERYQSWRIWRDDRWGRWRKRKAAAVTTGTGRQTIGVCWGCPELGFSLKFRWYFHLDMMNMMIVLKNWEYSMVVHVHPCSIIFRQAHSWVSRSAAMDVWYPAEKSSLGLLRWTGSPDPQLMERDIRISIILPLDILFVSLLTSIN